MTKMRISNVTCLFLLVLLSIFLPIRVHAASYAKFTYVFLSTNEEIKAVDLDLYIELWNYQSQLSKNKKGKYYPGDNINIDKIPESTTIECSDIIWKYDHIVPDTDFIAKSKNTITVYWKPELKEGKREYTVSYKYAYEPSYVTPPEDKLKSLYPLPLSEVCQEGQVISFYNINSELGEIEDVQNDGVWEPKGFRTAKGESLEVVQNSEVTCVWEFKGNEHIVSYRAISADSDIPFPDELLSQVQPQYENQVVLKGEWVQAYSPRTLEVQDETGTWYFCGYDKDVLVGKAKNSENYFLGTWKYSEKPLQVVYRFISTVDSIELPDRILQYLPYDTTGYLPGEAIVAIQPSAQWFQRKGDSQEWINSREISWNFTGYNHDEQVAGTEPVEFVGGWTPIATIGRTVGCVFESTDESEILPDFIRQKAPATYYIASQETQFPELEQNVYEVTDGKWIYDHFVHKLSSDGYQQEMYIIYWKFEEGKRKISYDAISETEGRIIPESVQVCLPEGTEINARNVLFSPQQPSSLEVSVDGGKWIFTGYQPLTIMPGCTELVFVTSWEFVEDGKVVRLQFRSDDDDETLPESVLCLMSDQSDIEPVSEMQWSGQNTVEVSDGKWVFDRFERDEAGDTDEYVLYIGIWRFEEATREIRYTACTVLGDKVIPSSVLEVLPEGSVTGVRNTAVRPKDPQRKVVEVEDGVWIYEGYQPLEIQPVSTPIVFTSIWRFLSEEKAIEIVYASRQENEPLPESIREMAPQPYSVEEFDIPEAPEICTYEVQDGTWVFDGYETGKSNRKSNIVRQYIGYWKYEEGTRQVAYGAVSGTDEMVVPESILMLLPSNSTVNARKTDFEPEQPSKTFQRIGGGRWIFTGYQETEIVPGTEPVMFVSVWVYQEDLTTTVTLVGKVELSGHDLRKDMFEFVLIRNENVLETVKNEADGTFSFSALEFTSADIDDMPMKGLEYKIMQVNGGETYSGITIDDRTEERYILLREEDGQLIGEYGDPPVFRNTYNAEQVIDVLAHVELTGLELCNCELAEVKMQPFEFELREADGGDWVSLGCVTCNEEGEIVFNLYLHSSDVGLHRYEMRQCGEKKGFLGDTRCHRFMLDIKDNGKGGLDVEPIYEGCLVAALNTIKLDIRDLVFTNRVESESITYKPDENLEMVSGWQLFANGVPVSTENEILEKILTENETEVRFRGLPMYDLAENQIDWSVQPVISSETRVSAKERMKGNTENAGDKAHKDLNGGSHTGNRFEVEVEVRGGTGLDVSKISVQLLKDGKPSMHSLRSQVINERITFFAEDLGSGNYIAQVKPITGYTVQYKQKDGQLGDAADNGGKIYLTYIPNTGDRELLMLYVVLFVLTCGLAGLYRTLPEWKSRK